MSKDFITNRGVEVFAVTAKQMSELDRIAIEETGPNLFQMMENAGRNLMLSAIEMLGRGWQKANIIVLVGTGGNGGGGICAARHLANHGAQVTICLSNSSKLRPVSTFQLHIYKSSNGREITFEKLSEQSVDLILDAIIGYSLVDVPFGLAADLIKWANNKHKPIISLDIPSGVNATSGESQGEYIRANQTITLAVPKTGLLPNKCGDLFLADIGIPSDAFGRLGMEYESPFEGKFLVPLIRK